MFAGAYGAGGESLPRVLHLSVSCFRSDVPRPGDPMELLVTIHEEGIGISWQQNVSVDPADETALLEASAELNQLALGRAPAASRADEVAARLGERLYDIFIGPAGTAFLDAFVPTAILLDIDETILNLPWELIGPSGRSYAQDTPFGRLVTTRTIPARGRDPLQEDAHVRFFVVANPTGDLSESSSEVEAIRSLEGSRGAITVEVTVLEGAGATRARTCELLASGDFDVLHFSGHAALDTEHSGMSAIALADGPLSADAILRIPWPKPPGFVFGSACETGGSVAGRRLLSDDRQANGLAAAFLSAGVYAYAGFFWPVTDSGAALFTGTFYKALFGLENVGLAFQVARQTATHSLGAFGDLTGHGAILYGDAASKHRRDVYSAR